VLVALTAATVRLIYGYDLGAISGALLFLKDDFGGLSSFEQSAVTSVVVVGQIFGALVGWQVANRFGRKKTMVAIAIGFAVFAVLSSLAPDKYSLAAARFFLGVSIGVSIVAAPAYVAEMAPAPVRGALLVAFQIATTSGIAIAYFVDVALAGTGSWRLMLALSAVAAIVVLVLIARLRDTPRWYVMQGRRDEALSVLRDADPWGRRRARVVPAGGPLGSPSHAAHRHRDDGARQRAADRLVRRAGQAGAGVRGDPAVHDGLQLRVRIVWWD
jgi:MFS family permease